MLGYGRLPVDIKLSGELGSLGLFQLRHRGILWGYYSYDLSFKNGIWDLYLISGGNALIVWFSAPLVIVDYYLKHFHLFEKTIFCNIIRTSGIVIMEEEDEQLIGRMYFGGMLVELSRKSLSVCAESPVL